MAATTFQTSAIGTLLRYFSTVAPLSPAATEGLCKNIDPLTVQKYCSPSLLMQPFKWY